MEYYKDIKQMLCKELKNIAEEGKLTAGNLDAIDKITHSIKSLVTIMAMEEGGYSQEGNSNGYSGRRDSMGRYADNGNSYRSYDDGGGYSGRRYSRDEGKSQMVSHLESLMGQAQSQQEREVMQQALDRLRNM